MNIKVKKLYEEAVLPHRGSASAAGYDLCSGKEHQVTIQPGETKVISTGLAMEIPEGYFGGIYARSGLASKKGLRPANCVGIVDSDYRGDIGVALHNDSSEVRILEPHERIAQLIIQPFLSVEFDETDELTDTERGQGGFGSTGK